MPQKTGLLEYLASAVGCICLSNLHTINQSKKDILAALIQMIHPQDYSLHQWNDTLEYLAQKAPEQSAEHAKAALIHSLAP